MDDVVILYAVARCSSTQYYYLLSLAGAGPALASWYSIIAKRRADELIDMLWWGLSNLECLSHLNTEWVTEIQITIQNKTTV